MTDVKRLFTLYARAMNAYDLDVLKDVLHPDFIGTYPQSGELMRGPEGMRRQLAAFPGGGPSNPEAHVRLVNDDEERWVITPGYTVLPLSGPQRFTAVTRTHYPDGSIWHIVVIMEVRDSLIYRSTAYFAPEYEPPAWRDGLTERIPRDYGLTPLEAEGSVA